MASTPPLHSKWGVSKWETFLVVLAVLAGIALFIFLSVRIPGVRERVLQVLDWLPEVVVEDGERLPQSILSQRVKMALLR